MACDQVTKKNVWLQFPLMGHSEGFLQLKDWINMCNETHFTTSCVWWWSELSICILVLKGRNVLPAHHRVCIFFALTYDWFFYYTLLKDFTKNSSSYTLPVHIYRYNVNTVSNTSMPGDTEDILRENKLGVKKFLAYKQYLGIFIIIIFFQCLVHDTIYMHMHWYSFYNTRNIRSFGK